MLDGPIIQCHVLILVHWAGGYLVHASSFTGKMIQQLECTCPFSKLLNYCKLTHDEPVHYVMRIYPHMRDEPVE